MERAFANPFARPVVLVEHAADIMPLVVIDLALNDCTAGGKQFGNVVQGGSELWRMEVRASW